jgi:phage/conjugal plasmid C-4 type zinc finger TraR family protein
MPIAGWQSVTDYNVSTRKPWKPLFNQPIQQNMKGLESLSNSEHMTEDELGLRNEQLHQDLSLLQHRQAHLVDPDAVSAEWCEQCGAVIPEARRNAVPGVLQCVDCAKENERRARQWT